MISVVCTAGNHLRKLDAIVERLGGLSYFAGAEKKYEKVLVPDLGSLTSIYDRARELFYYLKGGHVDYGEEHSKASGRAQFGRVYEQGHYPQWDEDHPIHFVGHSADARVILVLHQLLADKAFRGYKNSSENWVLSVTPLSGAFNGRNERTSICTCPIDVYTMKFLF
ncbi:putative carboxylic ester hydrolase [Helianthus annuus]|nr:putative carboxylic ester hydrolase [Helianthus annuus]